MKKTDDNYITVRVDPELYQKWLKYVAEHYKCQHAGRYSRISEINSMIFVEAIKREMGT